MNKLFALQSGLRYEIAGSKFYMLQKELSSHLKQQALLFDQIGILGLDASTKNPMHPMRAEEKPLILELEWLRQIGIIFEPLHRISLNRIGAEAIRTMVGEPLFSRVQEKYEKLIKLKTEHEEVDDLIYEAIYEANVFESLRELDTVLLRLLSLVMEGTEKIRVVTTLPFVEYTHEVPDSSKSEAAQIVVNKLPLPNSETSWEQIIDYRNDPKNQENLLNLRRWVRKISNENLSPAEIEEEIEWLINEFQSHMRIHKMKANTETLEVLVKAPLEIIENLIKIKFSKIPEPFFVLKKRQISLLEAELNAPGREMSYIIKTQEAFQSYE